MSEKGENMAPCLICGHPVQYKESARGRITAVCKWQDGGCGGQVQAIMPDAIRALKAHMAKHAKPAAKDEPKPAAKDEGKGGSSLGFLDALAGGDK